MFYSVINYGASSDVLALACRHKKNKHLIGTLGIFSEAFVVVSEVQKGTRGALVLCVNRSVFFKPLLVKFLNFLRQNGKGKSRFKAGIMGGH